MARPDPKSGARIVDPEVSRAKVEREGVCRGCGTGGQLHAHHLVGRGQSGDDVEGNIVGLCPTCHTKLHSGEAGVRERIRLSLDTDEMRYVLAKKSWLWLDEHYPLPSESRGEAEASLATEHGEAAPVAHAGLAPGETCPTCERRIPYPRREDSPQSVVWSCRMPGDQRDVFLLNLESAADLLRVGSKPYHAFWTLLYALGFLGQHREQVAGALEGEGD